MLLRLISKSHSFHSFNSKLKSTFILEPVMPSLRQSFLVRFLILSFAFLPGSVLLHAQLVGGTIAGDIVDPNNAAVVGASVVIRNQETGGVRELITAQGGAFSAPSIPVACAQCCGPLA